MPEAIKAKTQVVCLNQEVGFSYQQQAINIANAVDEETILFAESYSGLIANELIRLCPQYIKHVVFAASFTTSPSMLLPLVKYLPSSLLNFAHYPKGLVARFLFGQNKSEYLYSLFAEAMNKVPLEVVRFRLNEIIQLEAAAGACIDMNVTYISAKQDNLVPSTAVNGFKAIYKTVRQVEVDGSHFVLQTNPQDCMDTLIKVLRSVEE
jgi:pimeloyl-ACP methyl ester carboxylesterase